MATSEQTGELFCNSPAPEGVTHINARCRIETHDGIRVVYAGGTVISHYAVADRAAEAHVMVLLVDTGCAYQNEVARAFGVSTRAVRRYARRCDDGGLSALGRPRGYPAGRSRLSRSQARQVRQWRAQGLSVREIAGHLGITAKAVRKRLRRLGWKDSRPSQLLLPFAKTPGDPKLSASAAPGQLTADDAHAGGDPKLSASAAPGQLTADDAHAGGDPKLSALLSAATGATAAEELPFTLDTNPADRSLDRLLACYGMLEDAAPLFQSQAHVPGAGALLALPALLSSGVLECAQATYGSLGPAFYGLRTTLLCLLFMALLRVKRAENLKEHRPEDLGRILGLDRAPEVKTLRRKLARLAAAGKAGQLGRRLARHRVASRGAALGFLYLDGHVRAYHGQHAIPKAHVARLRLPQPATTDYWSNDACGDPLFVLTAEANEGLVKMMLPKILPEIREAVGTRRVTVIFDRGGFSPKLFKAIQAAGFDLITYRRGRFRRAARRKFHECSEIIAGRKATYKLADRNVRLTGGVCLRQVTRLMEDGHQTPILTTRRDLSAFQVAWRMFERWRQENFFKYLREEFALDALCEYAVEPADPTRDVPNPHWNAASAQLKKLRADLTELRAQCGLAALGKQGNESSRIPAELRRKLREALRKSEALKKRRAKMPKRVPVAKVVAGPVVRLAVERQHLSNLAKMVAYQAESDLVQLIKPYYRRTEDEGRTLIQTALASTADIAVHENELRIRIAHLSSPHRTRAVAALCAQLNELRCVFPGTKLVLRFEITST